VVGVGLLSLLFSTRGRINRLQYWLASLGVYVGFWVLLLVGIVLGATSAGPNVGKEGAVGAVIALVVVGVPLLLVSAWCQTALQIKRLHDRGRSWAWSLLPIALYAPLYTSSFAASAHMGGGPGFASSGLYFAAVCLVALWMFVDLGCLPGVDGPNQYGDPPGGSGAPSTPTPRAPSNAASAASALFGAQSAVDRAIAEKATRAQAPVPPRTANAPPRPAAPASTAPASFGRRVVPR
jgi:uncharacterized membrane protein YhaH (DUF805 family)